MDTSYENARSEFSESIPLLEKSSKSVTDDQNTPTHSSPSIFTCAVVCILVTELCERLTFYSISGNIVYFATRSNHLNMTPAVASTLALMFQGICFTMPVLGGWLADSKGGKFSVILFSAVIYLLGTLLLPLGSIERNDSNKEKSQWAANDVTTNLTFMQAVYITGLFLVAFGTGGIKANVSPFGAEQISNRGPAAIQAFFSWFYWFINVGALVSYTVVVYIQQNISFFYGNLIPACALILSLIVFLSGKRTYVLQSPTESPLTKILNIIKEAIKKSRRPSLSSSFVNHWLDRAKMCFGGSYSSGEVEDVKNVFRLLPIFGTFIVYWTVYAQMFTSMIHQGENMNIKIYGDLDFPIASLALFAILGLLISVPVMDKFVYPLLARCGICPSQLQRIGLGMIIMTAGIACAGGLELYRVKECCMLQTRNGDVNATEVANITIFYQVPQYTLIGLSEVFASVTGLELAFTEAPKSLQGVIMGVFLLTTGLGFFLGAALVAIVNVVSKAFSGEDGKWFPDKKYVNKSHYLAYFFFLLAGLMFLNFIVYIFVALSFKKKKESASRPTMSREVMNNGKPPSLTRENEPDKSSWSSSQSSGNSAP